VCLGENHPSGFETQKARIGDSVACTQLTR